MCDNVYMVKREEIVMEYKSHEEISGLMAGYVLEVADADNIAEIPLEDVNSFIRNSKNITMESEMGRLKDWMMDMEEDMAMAIEYGASSSYDVLAFCRSRGVTDEKFIKDRLQEWFGPGDEITVDQKPEPLYDEIPF